MFDLSTKTDREHRNFPIEGIKHCYSFLRITDLQIMKVNHPGLVNSLIHPDIFSKYGAGLLNKWIILMTYSIEKNPSVKIKN